MPRLASLLRAFVRAFVLAFVLAGCKGSGDTDADRRLAWIGEHTKANKAWGRDFLNRAGDSKYDIILFHDGWFNAEHDPKTGGTWRWASRRGILRLRTKINGDAEAHDMTLKISGWVPHELMNVNTLPLELAVNGHVLERFWPPASAFEHQLFVPRWLLQRSDWVDFSITAANVIIPTGDWRELGFATTGFEWTRAN